LQDVLQFLLWALAISLILFHQRFKSAGIRSKHGIALGAFGPVPSSLQATGNKICGVNMKAIGYHVNAQDENRNTFLGGGYLCVSK
jgi:hypothetical protein